METTKTPERKAVVLTGEPTIELIADMHIDEAGVLRMAQWVKDHRPHCVPAGGFNQIIDLLPHGWHDIPREASPEEIQRANARDELRGNRLTHNEMLVELAGRKCYDSFAEAAGKKTNYEYMEHIFSMDVIHASILYHAKMTFFFAGVSRKFSHQFIRNYVGSDRDEEGAPSQESTRFTHHYGRYIAPPLIVETGGNALEFFGLECQKNYDDYNRTIQDLAVKHPDARRKEIYEAAAGVLSMSAETSFIWTTNPMAIRKFLKERANPAADAEMQRFSIKLAHKVFAHSPNLFVGDDLKQVRAFAKISA